jgi:hypothetical protein
MTNFPYTRRFAELKADGNESGLVGGWDMANSGLSVTDKSPGGNDGTLNGNFALQYGSFGREIRFDGVGGYIDIGDISANCSTIAFLINPTTTTESLIDLDGGTHTVSISAGTITATGFASPIIYVNGAVASTVVAGLPSFVVITTATPFAVSDLDIGRISAGYYDGYFKGSVRIYSDVKSANWVDSEYRRGKKALWVAGYGVDAVVSATGGPLSDTPLLVKSGTWSVNFEKVDGIDSYVVSCDATGLAYMPAGHFSEVHQQNAHGEFSWRIKKAAATTARVMVVASTNDLATAANQNGYYLSYAANGRVFLVRVTNGSSSNLFISDVDTVLSGTWYTGRLLRDNDKQFSYLQDGTLLPVTSGSNPVTNSDHLVSYYFGLQFGTGDKFIWASGDGRLNFLKRVII